ncbi:expressed unknown protein [Seminavis robusta]|uniref:Uncharacterized protein n=1 Tax=Seminavis robusta TaxID=568900 RepID=A0A9N8EX09_9STRA|nr:expressed unknown protein [Seminavis robusta]|eukprot:Sro1804_g298700.1 n/a (847) ;mRNA; f:16154-18781
MMLCLDSLLPPLASTCCILLSFLLVTASAKNMNGVSGQYKIANGLSSSSSSAQQQYSTDYTAEYFEVYSAVIKTRYSEVFWASMPPVPLPHHVVERFRNKTMAVVGYEVDQVHRDDTPVPITHAYNHHYCSWLVNSKRAKLVKKAASEEIIRAGLTHGSDEHWATQLLMDDDDRTGGGGDPMVQFFSEGNGGEMRLSYHGYPKGYAQLIASPDTFHLQPMQIDTWNRAEPTAKFQPGPLPRRSRIPPTAGYSGLLECPCSDRIVKQWNISYHLLQQQEQQDNSNNDNHCDDPVQSQAECWASAEQVTKGSVFRHFSSTGNNSSMAMNKPVGCSLVQHANGTVDVFWNHNKTSTAAESSDIREASSWMLQSRTRLENDDNLHSAVASTVIEADKVAYAAGAINITVAIQNSNADDAVIIMLVGPPDKWFGVGFGSHSMCRHAQSDQCPDGGPYAIIVEGDTVQERQLGNHGPGTVLPHDDDRTWKVHRNDIVGGNRTVVVTRPRRGAVFSFDDVDEKSLPIIMARGCNMTFAQHCGHGPGDLQFLRPETTNEICRSGIEGTIQNRKFRQEGRCPSFPRGDLKQHRNPTCEIETYQGGLYCCNHGQSLLDHNQSIPWPDQYLEYQLKFRFYFEEYMPVAAPADADGQIEQSQELSTTATEEEEGSDHGPSHQNLVRLIWATEGNAGEYDIAQCSNNTPPSQCIHVITSRFSVRDLLHDCGTHKDASFCTGIGSTNATLTAGINLIFASAHCHANSCLSMELYHANTGQLLCRVEPIYGQSDDGHGAYGDERGYLALPPCLWGSPSEGLPEPFFLPLDAELLSIKRNNNTLPHTGEMSLWQMRGIVIPK